MTRRVLFLHQNGVVGGAELYLLDVARHFASAGSVILFADGPLRAKFEAAAIDVRVAASDWAVRGVRGGRPSFSLSGTLDALRLASSVAQAARRHDLIFANSPKALIIAALAGRLSGRPVIWALHDLLEPTHFSQAAIRQAVNIANWGARRVLANTAASAAAFIDNGGRREMTEVVYYGFEPAQYAVDPLAAPALRRALRLDDRPVAGLFGRVTEWKGQHLVVELAARVSHLRLLIVGTEDPTYFRTLKDRVAELGIGERVSFLGHRDDVSELMGMVDMVLHTSVAPEPFGRVIVEAMLAGKPVVATAAGGVPEIIESGVSGLLVPPGDVDALVEAVSALLRDPAMARDLALAGKARAQHLFAMDAMLAAIDRHVEEVVGA